MEEKVIISKRFRNNTLKVYQYLLKEFSVKTAYSFPDREDKLLEITIEFYIQGNPYKTINFKLGHYLFLFCFRL